MKKFLFAARLCIVLLLLGLLQGCTKDSCRRIYQYSTFTPVYKTKEAVLLDIKSHPAKNIQSPGKIVLLGNYIFLNDINKGIHIIDNSNPAAPVNKAFIDIPGNVDIAIKGNTLYADLYADLVEIDISNVLNVKLLKVVKHVFSERFYSGFSPDSTKVITGWIRKDTALTLGCSSNPWSSWSGAVFMLASEAASMAGSNSFAGGAPTGITGSMSRFAMVGNYLYMVSSSRLEVMDVSAPAAPVLVNSINLGWGIETIYPFKDKLFIGSNTGMFIYNIEHPASPAPMGTFTHARVCDPVIADDKYAYVTLRNGTQCVGFLNELNVVDIRNLNTPVLLKRYDLFNPHGLSKDGNTLLICDGKDGLKIYDAANISNLVLKQHIKGPDTYDVIAQNNIALVVAQDGLYQYDYSKPNDVKQLSKLPVTR
ncbi:MAG TPA: hypothetical protein PKC39_07990 [Ferruginibacter sp.]|nr:hypothetical protein [Ferruginibacter sp.]HMP20884.1 hypothetical protein [Ferruginibacter sp.]